MPPTVLTYRGGSWNGSWIKFIRPFKNDVYEVEAGEKLPFVGTHSNGILVLRTTKRANRPIETIRLHMISPERKLPPGHVLFSLRRSRFWRTSDFVVEVTFTWCSADVMQLKGVEAALGWYGCANLTTPATKEFVKYLKAWNVVF